MTELQYRVYEPEVASTPEQVMVMGNEIRSGLEDDHGAKCREIARLTGAYVLAFERPNSAGRVVFDLKVRNEMTEHHSRVHAFIARKLGKAINEIGFTDDVNIIGHSAGATAGLHIVPFESIPINSVVVADPTGVRKAPSWYSTFIEYAYYTAFKDKEPANDQFSNQQLPEELINNPPQPAEKLRRYGGELLLNTGFWRSTSTLQTLEHIGRNMPGIGVDVAYPENTFTAKPYILWYLADHLSDLRAQQPHSAPFNVDVLAGQFHRYFANVYRFIDHVQNRLAVLQAT